MQDINQLSPEKQLDFWLGEWDVSWGEGQHGTNHIQRVLDGLVIQEDFDGRPLSTSVVTAFPSIVLNTGNGSKLGWIPRAIIGICAAAGNAIDLRWLPTICFKVARSNIAWCSTISPWTRSIGIGSCPKMEVRPGSCAGRSPINAKPVLPLELHVRPTMACTRRAESGPMR